MCAVGLLAAAVAVAGCGKKKSSVSDGSLAEGAAITISGQLALENSSSAAALALDGLNATSDVSVADLKVYCVSFSFPPKAGTGTVDADGNFSLSIEANDVAVGCFVLKGTETVATMTFENSETKNVNGETQSDSRLAFSGNTNMGKIALDTATGKAKASVANFKSAVKAFSGNGFDFSGNWTLKASTDLPEGYQTACAANTQCEGPKEGERVFLKRIVGKRGEADVSVASIWSSEDAFKACGSRLGFSNAEAQAAAGVDFSNSGVTEGPFTWSDGWVEGWKYTGAVTQRPMRDCGPYNLNGIGVFRCKASAANGTFWEVSLNSRDSGCKLADGTPAKIDDWSKVTWTTGNCNGTFDKIPALKVCTSGGTYNGAAISCQNIGGAMTDDMSAAFQPSGTVSRSEVAVGTTCSSNSLGSMQQLQCYADYYFQNSRNQGPAKCVRDVQLNWGAPSADKFVMRTNGPTRAREQHLMGLVNYTSTNTAALRDEKEYFRGFPVKDKDGRESFVNCKIIEAMNISMTKLTDSEILFEMTGTQRSVDQNPLCNAQTGGERGMVQKMMFKAVKQ
jgi:hypothetical protein